MIKRCKLSKEKQLKLQEMFVAEARARTTAELVGVNRNTAILYYRKLRAIIAQNLNNEAPFEGEIEIDESYFGGKRKGKRGR